MQLLLCINNKPMTGTHNRPEALALIKEGKEYEGFIIDSKKPDGSIVKSWRIPSIYNGRDAYSLDRFIPIDPDLDETTMVNEEWEEKNCVPVNK